MIPQNSVAVQSVLSARVCVSRRLLSPACPVSYQILGPTRTQVISVHSVPPEMDSSRVSHIYCFRMSSSRLNAGICRKREYKYVTCCHDHNHHIDMFCKLNLQLCLQGHKQCIQTCKLHFMFTLNITRVQLV